MFDEISRCHALVWRYRAELEEVWPTPSPLHSLMFAVTEYGEMIDAHMRTFPEYVRNNHREVDELGEAADVAMMLLTALGESPEWVTEVREWDRYSDLAAEVMGAYFWHEHGHTYAWVSCACRALTIIASMPGMELEKKLEKKLERTKRKLLV